MNCDEARTLVHAYTDGELALESVLEMERHLAECAGCARERSSLGALSAALRDSELRHAAPPALRARVAASIADAVAGGAEQPEGGDIRAARTGRWRRDRRTSPAARGAGFSANLGWALAGAACALLAVAIINANPVTWRPFGAAARPSAGRAALASEVLASHLRSLMPGHLMDVASTDRHTVKPWFNGRVDFSPPVSDFAAAGFRLAGGRLDYLDGRTVAALVYQRRKHIVNVFVWPAAAADETAIDSVAMHGFNLMHWRRGGMNVWLASDLNAAELRDLARLLRGESMPARAPDSAGAPPPDA